MKIREISSTPLYRKDCKICYDHKCNYIPKSGNNGRYRKLSLIPAPGTQFLQLHRNHNALQRHGRLSQQCNIPPCHLHNYVLFALSSDWWKKYVFLLFYWQIFQIILPCLCPVTASPPAAALRCNCCRQWDAGILFWACPEFCTLLTNLMCVWGGWEEARSHAFLYTQEMYHKC